MNGDSSRLIAEIRAVEGVADAQRRELTADEVAKIQTIYRQLDEIDAAAESSAGWLGL
jgi:hypothetical protein